MNPCLYDKKGICKHVAMVSKVNQQVGYKKYFSGIPVDIEVCDGCDFFRNSAKKELE